MIVVDSSIWVDHIHVGEPRLEELLLHEQALMHPHVLGEIALGSIRNRDDVLARLERLPVPNVARDGHVLAERLALLRERLAPDGFVWVSWPRKASKVTADITEDVIRDVALPMGFVDVKVCSVDAVWSGLKLVIRQALRNQGDRA